MQKTIQSLNLDIYLKPPQTNVWDSQSQGGTRENPFNDFQDTLTRMALKVDTYSQNIKLNIQPLYCQDSSDCFRDTNEKAIIKSKIGDRLTIQVGQGLTLKNIIIDSLDSMIDFTSDDSCLRNLEDCCMIDPLTLQIKDVDPSTNICQDKKPYQTEECNIPIGSYIFKFDISATTVLLTPPTLKFDKLIPMEAISKLLIQFLIDLHLAEPS
ncbi:UNKNOWN [Stylonychia lemnae]|uniref:Uncharacterized protein n=1 Tax=Stylonychia lemnae TaxID=5949 RepID=A0A078AR32_STYLE|nr:UNKNOWN [Stylonychia lemnae]|eukprot:CDW84679.1 UNKNOWN [Stylonychia lemnae]